MAVLKSIATGNFLTSTTWGVVDATSYLNSETGSDILSTAYSGTRSSAFTPGAITVAGIGVKLSVRTGTTGTMSVSLRNSTIGLDDFVTGTEVTIDTADLPVAATADLNGGWMYFEFASPVLLLAANNYNIQAKTSSTSQVSLFRDGTTDNISRILVTSTTAAPGAGDDLIVAGEYIDASTFNAFTVTMDALASAITDYGAASTSLVTPSLAICNGGTLTYGTTAATDYYLKLSGNAIVYSGGTLSIGTTGTPIPRDSSAVLEFDCGANVDFGLTVRNLGTWNSQGLSRTSGKNIFYCKLNTDEAANSTSLGVDTDTGWLDNDEIAVASTTRTRTDSEKGTLNGNAGASSLTVDGFAGAGGGLAVAHSGTSPTQAEVILLTHNVKVRGISNTLQAFIDIRLTATVDIDWTEFYFLGSNVTDKQGFNVNTTTGTFNCQFSSIHSGVVTSSRGFAVLSVSGSGVTISNNVTFNIASNHLINVSGSTSTTVITNNIFILNVGAGFGMAQLNDVGITFTGNTVVSGIATGISLNEAASAVSFSDNVVHSCTGSGVSMTGLQNSTLTNTTVWRNNSVGLFLSGFNSGVTFDGLVLFGNLTSNMGSGNSMGMHGSVMLGLVTSGDSTFATTNGIAIAGYGIWDVAIRSGDFSTVSGIKTAHTNDINITTTSPIQAATEIVLDNCLLGGTSEVTNQSLISPQSYIGSQRHDQTDANHKTWKKYGTIAIETGTVQSGTTAFSMTPANASNKLVSGSFYIPVADTATLSPSVYVNENGSYNGARARLILKRNDAIGITSDTVIDTATAASDGAWEQLTGTTAAATDDGVMEFVVDCDGTAGILFVDSFTVS